MAIMPSGLFTPAPFDSLIGDIGCRVGWRQAHSCPCRGGQANANGQNIGPGGNYPMPGQGDPQCQTCSGLGIYWDDPESPFTALITESVDPGMKVDPALGQQMVASPMLTLSYAQDAVSWTDASTYDQIIKVDAVMRNDIRLRVGYRQVIPFQQNLTVASTGAVKVYNPQTKQVIPPVNGYTVSGSSVAIPGYAKGTEYVVQFTAAPTYVILRDFGGLPHVRPFLGQATPFPRRFHLQMLDLWLRGPGNHGGIVNAGTVG